MNLFTLLLFDRPQHLSGLQLVSDLCKGELLGGAVKSSEITFIPSTIQSGRFIADTKTAGSVDLDSLYAMSAAVDFTKLFLT